MTSERVRWWQELRRSNASGPHGRGRPEVDDEPCLCATGFTCVAEIHDDEQEPEAG